jgi:hypothetical protein
MRIESWTITVFRFVLSVYLLALCGSAFAQTVLTTHSKTFLWDDGNASREPGTGLEVYSGSPASNPAQAFTWKTVPNGFTICNDPAGSNLCLSDNNKIVVVGSKADVFALRNWSGTMASVFDVTTGRYIEIPGALSQGDVLATGTDQSIWNFAVASAPTPPPTPPASQGGPITIMMTGDSIILGAATTPTFNQGGARCPLYWDLLTHDPGQFTFVGYAYEEESPSSGGFAPVTECPATAWAGHGGDDIEQIQAVLDGDGSLTNLKPQIITLLAGTNNVAKDEDLSTVYLQMVNLLRDIYSHDPEAVVIVSTIPPMNPSASQANTLYSPGEVASWAPKVPLANLQLRAAVAQFPQAILMDYYSAISGNVDLYVGSDGVHPSVNGFDVLGDLSYSELSTYRKASAAASEKLSAAN